MKNILLTMLFTILIPTNILAIDTYPQTGSVNIPYGNLEIGAVSSGQINITPSVSGNTIDSPNDFLKYYHDNDWHPHYFLLHSTVSVFKPTSSFSNSTSYNASIPGVVSFNFLTDPYLYFTGEQNVVTEQSPAFHKPSGGICSQGTVVVWQSPVTGIMAKIHNNSTGTDTVINVDTTYFYSQDIGPSLSINSNCDFLVVYMADYNLQNSNIMLLRARRYHFDGTQYPLYNYVYGTMFPSYVVNHKQFYKMQFDTASPDGAFADNGKYAITYIEPKCFARNCDPQNCTIGEYQCDNFVRAIIFNSDGSSNYLGSTDDTGSNNEWAPYPNFKIVNLTPVMKNYNTRNLSYGCGGQGSAYACPYHSTICMSNNRIFVNWIEYWGTYAGNWQNAWYDDLHTRGFDGNGNAFISERIVPTSQGARYDHWSIDCSVNNQGYAAFVWSESYKNGNPAANQTDIFGRFMNPSGSWTTEEFYVNEDREDEQYSPTVTLNEANEALYAWLSYGTDRGGYGVYGKIFDVISTNALTNQFRGNKFNNLVCDVEEYFNVAQSNYTWSYYISASHDDVTGNFLITYPYPDYLYVNSSGWGGGPASYGRGYSVKMSELLDSPQAISYMVRLINSNTSYYNSVQSAYNVSSITSVNYLDLKSTVSDGNVYFNRSSEVYIRAGYDNFFQANIGSSKISNLTISNGKTVIESGTLIIGN